MVKHVQTVSRDFELADLGDARRTARLVQIVEALERAPSSGFPQALESAAELEGFYRFINNDGFDASAVYEPHRTATLQRATEAKEVLVVHDTTAVEYKGENTRAGLGYTTTAGRQGFMAHASLVIGADGVPLGLAHLATYTRQGHGWRKRAKNGSSNERESKRWLRGVDAAEPNDAGFRAIHVMDAEADFFELLGHLHNRASRYVIRAGNLRRQVHADGAVSHLHDVLRVLRPKARRRVELSARGGRKGRTPRNTLTRYPPRKARTARLAISAMSVRLPHTGRATELADGLDVNVVRVWEPHPPASEPPVEWILLTSEPIGSAADLARIVDIYRARWIIEDYFKALKTGCSLERRQIESYDALRKMLAILAPIAWRLLYLRGLTRQSPKRRATWAFSTLELELLSRAAATRGRPRPKNVSDALTLLARLGGHLKNNGPPGWQTLARGYEKLLLLRMGWQLAIESQAKASRQK
jgi:hypothetical protein